MVGAHLVKESRRRAAISQSELGERVGRSQSAIARWERGEVNPSLETVQELIAACGLSLGLDLFAEDKSYELDIRQQLGQTPQERLEGMVRAANNIWRSEWSLKPSAREPWRKFDPFTALAALHESRIDYVLIGALAATVRGSPLIPTDRRVVITPSGDPENIAKLEGVLGGMGAKQPNGQKPRNQLEPIASWLVDDLSLTVEVRTRPRATAGYRDLRRDADFLKLSVGAVLTASVLDLLRVSRAAIGSQERVMVPALTRLLQLENKQM